MARFERLGSFVAPIYNFAAGWGPSASLIKKIVGFAPEREIPKIRHSKISAGRLKSERKVCLFIDEFTRYQESGLADACICLLEGLGYQVILPKHVESGRAAISKGCLTLARKYAVSNVARLKDIVGPDVPLVGIEPSCILSFRDEYPDLVPAHMREDALRLAGNCLLYDEFFMREVEAGRISPEPVSRRSILLSSCTSG